MELKKNLLRDVVMLSFTRIIIIISSFLQGIILIRALSKGEYAVYAQVLIPLNIVTNLFSLSLPNSVNYFATRTKKYEEKIDFLSKVLTLIILLSLVGSFSLFFCRSIIAESINAEIYSVLSIAFILPLFRLVSKAYDNIFIVENKTRKVVHRKTFMAVCQVITAVYVYVFEKDVLTLFVIIIIYEFLMFSYMLFTIRKEIGKVRLKFFTKFEMKKVLAFSLPLAVASFVGTINNEAGKIFINHYYGSEKFAEYVVVARELPINIIAAAVSAVLVPQISRYLGNNENKSAISLWKSSVELSLISTSWIIGFLIVCSYETVYLLFSEKYIDGVPIFIIFTISMIFKVIYFGMILNGSGNTHKIFYSALFSLSTNLILLFTLQPLLGYYSAAISALISIIVMNAIQLYFSKGVLGITFLEMMPWRNIIKIILSNVFIGIVLYILKTRIISNFGIGNFYVMVIIGFLWLILFSLLYYRRFNYLKNNYNEF